MLLMHFGWDLNRFRYHSPLMRYFMVHKSTIENTCAHWINLQLLWNAHWKNETWLNVINLSMVFFFSLKLNPFWITNISLSAGAVSTILVCLCVYLNQILVCATIFRGLFILRFHSILSKYFREGRKIFISQNIIGAMCLMFIL